MASYGNAQPVDQGYTLREGQKFFTDRIDFSGGLSQEKNYDLATIGLSCVRTIFVVNDSAYRVRLIIHPLEMALNIPPGTRGYYSVVQMGTNFAFSATINTLGAAASTDVVTIGLLNYDREPVQYGARGLTTAVVPTQITAVSNYSGVIAAAGVSQQIEAANQGRARIIICNPSTATLQGIAVAESLWLGFGAAGNNPVGAGSIEILAGQTWDSGGLIIPAGVLRLNAATVNHAFTCLVF